MDNQGWISLHRKLMDNPMWLSEPFTRSQAWIDLIMLANHEYGYFYVRGNKIDVQRGEVARSEEQLALRWKWSRTKLRTFLKMLEKEQQIRQQKSKVINRLTIINYETYQKKDDRLDNRKTTEERQTRQQKNINNNNNNKNNDNNDNNNKEYIGDFEHLWGVYGRIGSKQQALKQFNKIKGVNYEEIIRGHERYARYCESNGGWYKKQHMSTWLNNNGWESDWTIQITESRGTAKDRELNEAAVRGMLRAENPDF